MLEIVPPALRDVRIRSELVAANGLQFEVDVCGSGQRLALCLHGFPEHSFSWRFQLPMLADLGFKAWAPNLRGYGNTTRPEGMAAYRMDELIEDVAGLIEASGCKETVLIAHDWGAVIAWQFALRKRLPLAKLIICNVPHPQAMSDAFGWEQLKKSWYVLFFQIPMLPERLLGKDGAAAIGQMMRDTAVDKNRFPAEVGEVYRRNAAAPGALTAMVNYYRGLLRPGKNNGNVSPKTPIDTPTLMVWGEDDVALSKSTTLTTHKYVNNFTVRYLKGVSHWVQQEQPEAVNEMMSAFLTDQPVPEYSKN